MKMRRGLSLFLSALVVAAGTMAAKPANAVENTELPQIRFAVPNHYPLYAGENQSVFVSTSYDGAVQYRAFVKDADGKWAQITEGYTEAKDGKVAVEIKDDSRTFKAGDNYIVIWVKRADQTGANVKTVKESEIPELANQEVSYDTYKVVKVVAREGQATLDIQNLPVDYDGLNVSVEGNDYYAIQALDVNDDWETKAEYTQGSAERTFEAGQYLMDVWVDKDGNGYPDAYKLEYKELANTAKEVSVFTSQIVPGAMVGTKVNLALTEEGSAEYANAKNYQVFAGEDAISAVTVLGENTVVFPAQAEGAALTAKLLDANNAVVETIDFKLGENGVVTKEAQKPVEEVNYEVTAKFVPGAMVGSKLVVNTAETYEGVVKYQVMDNGAAVSAATAIGENTVVFPGKAAGSTVTVNLLAEDGTVLGTVENVTIAE